MTAITSAAFITAATPFAVAVVTTTLDRALLDTYLQVAGGSTSGGTTTYTPLAAS